MPAFRGALLKAVAKWEFSSSRGAQRGAYPASRKERGLDHPTTLRCCLSWALHMPCPGGHRQDTGGTVCRQRGQWINSAQRYEMTPTRNVHGQERHQNLGSRVCRKTWAWKSAGWESKVTLTGPSLPSPALNGPHLPIPTLPHLTCSQRPSPAHTCAHWPESAPTCPYLYPPTSPALAGPHLPSPALTDSTCPRWPSPALTCQYLTFTYPHLPSPAHTCLHWPSFTLTCPHLPSLALISPRLPQVTPRLCPRRGLRA